MIRVNHAGEFGAVRIYQGQLAFLRNKKETADKIAHMLAQEEIHFKTFDDMIKDRHVRPTVLSPLWNVAGYALGAGTALLGEKAAMAILPGTTATRPPPTPDLAGTPALYIQSPVES